MKKKILSVVMLLSMLLMCGAGACSGGGDDYPFPTLAPDWSNRTSEEMPGAYGGWFNLWKSRGGVGTDWEKKVLSNAMLDREVTTEDGTINVFLNYSFTEDEYKGEKTMKTVILVTVNDEICDFTLDGQMSEKGLLITEKPMGKELTEALSVEKCNLVKGDNELAVYAAVYYPSGFVTATSISRIFVSEVEQTCSADYGYDVRELSGSEVVISEGKDEREIRSWLGKNTEYLCEKISFDSSNRCITAAADSEIKLSFPNQRGDKGAAARKAIALVLKNGQPIGAWDGETIGSLVLSEEDLYITLPITIEKEAEEYTYLTFVFFDTDYDIEAFFVEQLFYFQ